MWHEMEIDNRPYYFYCKISDSNAEAMIYDKTDIWRETIRMKILKLRLRNLNGLVDYCEKEMLNAMEYRPETMIFDDEDNDRVVILTYRINGEIMHVEWNIKKLNSADLLKAVVQPLFRSLRNMRHENIVLDMSLNRKCKELKRSKKDEIRLRICATSLLSQIRNE